MTGTTTEAAWAKLNLSLDVLGARSDGFHDLRMVMQSVDLHDDVTVTLTDGKGITCRVDGAALPCDERNLAVKAARAFCEAMDYGGGIDIALTKRIPSEAGMAGGSADAAGYDLYACPADGQCVTIAPHATAMIGTGLALAIPAGYFGGVFARSGLASKQGLRPANCVGVIDADYRGECTVALHNDTDAPRTVAPGDRIAQLVILPFLAAEFAEADALDETDRGAGGFGSTGR